MHIDLEILLRAVCGATVSGLLACGPFLLLSSSRRLRRGALLVFSLFLLDSVAVMLPPTFGARGLTWACLGKLCQLLVLLVAAGALGGLCPRWPKGRTWIVWAGVVAMLTVLASDSDYSFPGFSWLVYQASLPGFVEEFVYRGLMLSVMDRHFGRPKVLLGVRMGWGTVVTTLLFYFAHALAFDQNWSLSLDLSAAPDFAAFGFAMCWLRYKFDSVWPSVLSHNLHNLLLCLST